MDRLLRLTLAFGQDAVAYLRLGRNAPLYLDVGKHLFVSTGTLSISVAANPMSVQSLAPAYTITRLSSASANSQVLQ